MRRAGHDAEFARAAECIWLATRATDLRKSFDSLAELVRQQLQSDPLSGQLFIFRNKRADRIKLLYWDEDGFVIVYKRLELGTFRFPEATAAGVEIRAADLQMLPNDLDTLKRMIVELVTTLHRERLDKDALRQAACEPVGTDPEPDRGGPPANAASGARSACGPVAKTHRHR